MLNWINNIISNIQVGIDFLFTIIKETFSFLYGIINIFPAPFNAILYIFLIGVSAIYIIKIARG